MKLTMMPIIIFDLLAILLLVLAGMKKLKLRVPGVVYPVILLLPAWLLFSGCVSVQCLLNLLESITFGSVMRYLWDSLLICISQAVPVGIMIASDTTSRKEAAVQGRTPGLLRQNGYALTQLFLYQLPLAAAVIIVLVNIRIFSLQNGGVITTLLTLITGFLLVFFLIPFGGLAMGIYAVFCAYIGILLGVCLVLSMAAAITSAVRCGKALGKKASVCVLLSLVPVYNIVFLIQLRIAMKKKQIA